MEGYLLSGSNEGFDDFDIEKKSSVDDFIGSDDHFSGQKSKQVVKLDAFEEKRLLNLKVDLDDGTLGYVFTKIDGNVWKCDVCSVQLTGAKNIQQHEASKRHIHAMQAATHRRFLFSRVTRRAEVPHFAPGEPAPPGFEDEIMEPVATTKIQTKLDSHKQSPLIGLEYLVELTEDYEQEASYVCMLCDKRGDPHTVMAHLVSYNHRLKYIERHFPVTFNAINSLPKTAKAKRGLAEIVLRVSNAMEEKFGRLHPLAADGRHFEEKRFEILRSMTVGQHFVESTDNNFVNLVDRELLITMANKPEETPAVEASNTSKQKTNDLIKTTSHNSDSEIEFQGVFTKGTRVPINRQLRKRRNSGDEDKKVASSSTKLGGSKADDTVSLSSISSSGSFSSEKSPYRRYRRSESRDRSRPRYRYRRSSSRSRSRRSRSRSWSRTRRSRSRSRSNERWRRGRQAVKSKFSDKKDRSTSREKRVKDRAEDMLQEKLKWERFREEIAVVEKEMSETLQFHEKNPEKHPKYPEEWKLFWGKRYKELQASGRDPSKHDFKPEWIEFWNRRMRDLHEQDFMKKKEEIRSKLELPVEEVKPNFIRRNNYNKFQNYNRRDVQHIFNQDDVGRRPKYQDETMRRSRSQEKTGKRSRSPSPWEEGSAIENKNMSEIKSSRAVLDRSLPERNEEFRDRDYGRDQRDHSFGSYRRPFRPANFGDEPVRTITVLRVLTALEQQLGSLGPRVNGLLSDAIALEKSIGGHSDYLLAETDVIVLFETVKEKLKGQLFAGIVDRHMINATKHAIAIVSELISNGPALLDALPPKPRVPSPKIKEGKLPTAPTVSTLVGLNSLISTTSTTQVAAPISVVAAAPTSAPADGVVVAGVGTIDKIAIANHIIEALVSQGKTDVTEEELEQLVNAVIGRAQTQSAEQKPPDPAVPPPAVKEPEVLQVTQVDLTESPPQVAPVSALQLLQSAYDVDDSGKAASTSTAKLPSSTEVTASEKLQKIPTNVVAPTISKPVSGSENAEVVVPIPSPSPFKGTTAVSMVNVPPATDHRQSTSVSVVDLAEQEASTANQANDLTEHDLRLLLQSFKELPYDEQFGLIKYLKRLEATDPERVEKLRKFVNVDPNKPATSNVAAAAIPQEKLNALARALSPFGGSQSTPAASEQVKNLDDSDDDYTFDDVVKAAAENVNAAEEEERRKKQRENEILESKLREEKAKAERALDEIEDHEREQKRLEKKREERQRAAALAMGAANWLLEAGDSGDALSAENNAVISNVMGNLNSKPIIRSEQQNSSLPPAQNPVVRPPVYPPSSAPPPHMDSGYGYNTYYPPQTQNPVQPYGQYNSYDQQGYYPQQNNSGMYHHQQNTAGMYAQPHTSGNMYNPPPNLYPPPPGPDFPPPPFGAPPPMYQQSQYTQPYPPGPYGY